MPGGLGASGRVEQSSTSVVGGITFIMSRETP